MGTEAWRTRGKNFQLDLMQMANLDASSSWREVQDAVSENWQPREIRRGKATKLVICHTRGETIQHYRHVRDIAAHALEDELTEDEGDAHARIRELGESYAVAFNADAKEGARASAEKAVDAIAAKIKHAMAAADFEHLDAAIEAFCNAGLEAMQAFKSAVQQHYDAGATDCQSYHARAEQKTAAGATSETRSKAGTEAEAEPEAEAEAQPKAEAEAEPEEEDDAESEEEDDGGRRFERRLLQWDCTSDEEDEEDDAEAATCAGSKRKAGQAAGV